MSLPRWSARHRDRRYVPGPDFCPARVSCNGLLTRLSLERQVIAFEGELDVAARIRGGRSRVTVRHDDAVDADGQGRHNDEGGQEGDAARSDHANRSRGRRVQIPVLNETPVA